MIQLGRTQELEIVREVKFGVYLADRTGEPSSGPEQEVLLPRRQVPEGKKPGDKLNVFIYRDSEDRLIATVREPALMMGQTALLRVAQTGKIGAFLDWGLEKDLFLPFQEQRGKVDQGDLVLVSLYVDKSSRLCATMNVYENLSTHSPYREGDWVVGRTYEKSGRFGMFVAVDNRYSGLIPLKELYGEIGLGMEVRARVVKVHEDGKLDLSLREKAYLQMDRDAEKILALLDDRQGELPFTDKAAPALIAHETGMSKNEFKRAVGRLLKQGKISIGEKSIRRTE